MPEISVNIEVYCATCGDGICNLTESTKTRQRQEPCFRVEACPTCIKKAEDRGYDRGYAEAEAACAGGEA